MNRKMRYIHIAPDSIYTKNYIERINRLYNPKEHFFLVHQCDGQRSYKFKNVKAVKKVNWKLMTKLIKMSFKAKKVILHSLFIDKKMHVLFALMSCFMKKFDWYIWSADLYKTHWDEQKVKGIAFQKRVKKLCREILIHNLKTIIVVAEGDYVQARKWHSTKAKMVQAEYAYNLVEMEEYNIDPKKDTINILAGHGGSSSCKHIQMFHRISKYKDEKIKVYSVLSYEDDDKDYINKVISCGKEIFGDKFIPILNWMPYEEYMKILCNVDIAVFEGEVQMGAGNILYLLYYGKKVFLSAKNSIYHQLKKMNITCFELNQISNKNDFFQFLSEKEKNNNKMTVETLCSDKAFKKKWDKVFYS